MDTQGNGHKGKDKRGKVLHRGSGVRVVWGGEGLPGPDLLLFVCTALRVAVVLLSMCGIVFAAGWHAGTPSHCSCVQDDASIELMGQLRAANAVRG